MDRLRSFFCHCLQLQNFVVFALGGLTVAVVLYMSTVGFMTLPNRLYQMADDYVTNFIPDTESAGFFANKSSDAEFDTNDAYAPSGNWNSSQPPENLTDSLNSTLLSRDQPGDLVNSPVLNHSNLNRSDDPSYRIIFHRKILPAIVSPQNSSNMDSLAPPIIENQPANATNITSDIVQLPQTSTEISTPAGQDHPIVSTASTTVVFQPAPIVPKYKILLQHTAALLNAFGPDGVKFEQPIYRSDVVLNITIDRLQLKVRERLGQSTVYGTRLNQSTPITNETLYVSHLIYDGGLGNWMFMVASTVGLARANSRRPSLLQTYWPEPNFENFYMEKKNYSELLGNDTVAHATNTAIGEIGPGKFTAEMLNMTAERGPHNVMLKGYMQSWRYFNDYREEIRSLFTFNQKTFQMAVDAIAHQIESYLNLTAGNYVANLPTLVGIHVRRGDILKDDQKEFGHQPASEEYLLRAALHFERSYEMVLFLVISNDIPYCKGLFKEPNFLFLDGDSEAVDIAVLSLMDHIILSVGTYGWWGAYLSDAKEIYYFRDWPRNGSLMQKMFNAEDYFLPSWKPFE